MYYIMSTMQRGDGTSLNTRKIHTHTPQALVVNCTQISALSMLSYLWLYANEMLIPSTTRGDG